MSHTRHYVGPDWPPHIEDYDYVLTLCPSDLAWEFLRRNPDYQRDYNLNRKGTTRPRSLKSGHFLTRIRRRTDLASQWDLHSFRRSGAACTGSSNLLVLWSRSADSSRDFAAVDPLIPGRPLLAPSDLHRDCCRRADRRRDHPASRFSAGRVSPTFRGSRFNGAGGHHIPHPRSARRAQAG